MNPASRSRGGVFLLEFLIVLLIFALSSVVLLRLYAKSEEVRLRVEETDRAVATARTLLASLRACDGSDEAAAQALGARSGSVFSRGYDRDGQPADAAPFYRADSAVTFTDSAGGRLAEGTIAILRVSDGAAVYTLDFAVFWPAQGEEAAA